MTASLSPDDKQRITRRTPLQRLGCPSDLAGTVRFLLSDEARFITGAEFVVDGGLTA
jgi:3-oxoacyl-[acyl-carrier protein] reductase